MRLSYKDTIILIDPVITSSGSEKIGRQETVSCLLGPVTGFGHGSNQDFIDADYICYIDPEHFFVRQVANRLEGMLVITDLGEASADAWYRVQSVNVGRRNLTCNDIDNVQLALKKTVPIGYVS